MAAQNGVRDSQQSQKQLLIFARRGQLDDLKCRTNICRPGISPEPRGWELTALPEALSW